MSASGAMLTVAACALGGVASLVAVLLWDEGRLRARRRRAAFGELSESQASSFKGDWALGYCESLTKRLFAGSTEALSPIVRGGRLDSAKSAKRFRELASQAGLLGSVSVSGFCEARMRLACAGALAGGLFGSVFSILFALVLAAAGALWGANVPGRALKAARSRRGASAERYLSEMLEVVSLGLRSGLTFDRSFALYGQHFDNEFARSCSRTYRSWSLGLVTREDALRKLAASYDCEQLSRIVDSVVRGLRFGASLTGYLEDAASQSRATYRSSLEERVAKAPIKMMLPTGTLILPAMLLLVMGPVLLEIVGGF